MRIGTFGIWELLIILVLVLLIFGPRLIPNMTRSFFESFGEFRRGLRGEGSRRRSAGESASDDEDTEDETPPQRQL